VSVAAAAPRKQLSPGAWALAPILAGTAAAWLALSGRMAGMDGGPGGDPGTPAWFAGTWAVMVAAMMLPAVAPAVLRLVRGKGPSAPAALVLFLLGYGAVWMAGGLIGFALLQAVRALHIDALGWSHAGRYLAGAVVAAAALYQLTSAKRRWLGRCAKPGLPLPSDPAAASLRAGLRHGLCCLACCWTLMAALYALGMMSLVWMAVVTAMIVAERLLPRPPLGARVIAVVLAVLGIAIVLAPANTLLSGRAAMPSGAMQASPGAPPAMPGR
jgi:predicted metal-binding membrane protein